MALHLGGVDGGGVLAYPGHHRRRALVVIRMKQEITNTVTVATVKTAPAVAGAAWTLDTIVAAFTVGYIVLQAAYLIWRWRRDRKQTPD